jgi:hypothetical protein
MDEEIRLLLVDLERYLELQTDVNPDDTETWDLLERVQEATGEE